MAFIVFEGLDGAGKSTQMNLLQFFLEKRSVEVVRTREPGGTPLAETLRELVLGKKNEVPSPRAELLIYEAARAQHVDRVIRPALEGKKWVICDRFRASSMAFQGGGRELSGDHVEWLNDFATGNLQPNLTIFLDLTVEESQARIEKRISETGEEKDRLESEGIEFHQRIRESFLAQADGRDDWLVVSASQSIEEIFQEIEKKIMEQEWRP